jgi:hypothetical protein
LRLLSVPKNQLLLIAGALWSLAAAMVLRVGLPLLVEIAPDLPIVLPLAVAVFLAFYVLVFSRLLRKHTIRIRSSAADRLPVWNVFNTSSWVIMGVMVTAGMVLRVSHALPDWVVAFFYTGLGIALLLCGVRFLAAYQRGDARAAAVVPAGDPVAVEA